MEAMQDFWKHSKIDCHRVIVNTSTFSTPDNVFDGAFACVDIPEGGLVERGIVRRLSDNENPTFDGMNHSMVFTWSDDIPNNTWAFASGCATFYNTGLPGDCNTMMKRYFDEDRFEIFATKDIKAGDELTHTYKSLSWRYVTTACVLCFVSCALCAVQRSRCICICVHIPAYILTPPSRHACTRTVFVPMDLALKANKEGAGAEAEAA